MHFPIAIVEESFKTYGLLNVYSATNEAPERSLELFRQWGTEVRNPEPGALQEIIDRLHNEYLSHANDKFAGVKEQIGWHMAFGMLSFAVFSDDRCWIVHLGDRTVARIEQEGEFVRIAPIHDLRHEYAERTLDEAGLPALMNLTTETAEVMVGVPASKLPQLRDKTPGELAELLGSYYTRVIGDHYGELPSHNQLELTSHKAYISSIPLSRELNLVMLEREGKWPSLNIDEVRVTETTPLTSQNLGIKIHWQKGHPVEVSLLSLKE